MNKGIIIILIFLGFTTINFAQNDGVLAFDVPAKNSLKFNKFLINPSFSFVREDEAFLSVLNKRQFLGIDNAPEAYFVSYSGKFRDLNSLGLGLFQRKFGVLSSFGAVANYARNVELRDDNNLTFGLNLVYLNSGLNTGAVVVNEANDPSLLNAPKNSLFTINPGINYGTRFIDLGLGVNNLFYYNLSDSNIVSDDPKKSISGHFMYTGYLDNSGIFENSKFSTLLKADLEKEKTVLSGSILFNAPKAFWAQAGYHSLNGVSAGVGFTLAKKIAIGYTIEKGLSNFSNLGMSHEITLAYKIKGYGDFEDVKPIVRATNKTNPVKSTTQRPANEVAKERQAELIKRQAEQRAKIEAERQRRQQEMADAKAALDAKNKAAAEARLKLQQDRQNGSSEAARLKAEQEKARLEAERLRKEKELADAKSKAEEDKLRKEREAADAKAKADAQAEAARLKAEQEKSRLEAERLRKEKEEQDRLKDEALKLEASKIEEDKQIDYLSQVIEDSKKNQSESLNKLQLAVNEKKAELLEMRKANDLSEQGIVAEVKEYKSTSSANRALEALKLEIIENNKNQENLIKNYEKLAADRLKKVSNKNDALNQSYVRTLEKLKSDKVATEKLNSDLIAQLEQIKTETEIEKKRRIKRAQFDSTDAKYEKDRAALSQIKATTASASKSYKPEDFDYGDSQSNMQILKNVDKMEEGFYLVYAAHKDEAKRNEFVKKAIESGQNDVDFFYSVSTGTYYIYSQRFSDIQDANRTLEMSKGNKPFNGKMVIVKIEK